MYDVPGTDEGREWVEIQNTGVDSVDLAGWKLLENGIHHKVIALGSSVIAPSARAVIADSAETYRAEHPDYGGLIFDSSFSLKNTGETLVLENASGTEAASITYVPKPKPAPAPTPKTKEPISEKARNQKPITAVPQELAPQETPLAATGATIPESADSRNQFGILPWIVGLIAVIGIGVFAVFIGKPKNTSGYTIVEEKT
jgi:hypothetical protein